MIPIYDESSVLSVSRGVSESEEIITNLFPFRQDIGIRSENGHFRHDDPRVIIDLFIATNHSSYSEQTITFRNFTTIHQIKCKLFLTTDQ